MDTHRMLSRQFQAVACVRITGNWRGAWITVWGCVLCTRNLLLIRLRPPGPTPCAARTVGCVIWRPCFLEIGD